MLTPNIKDNIIDECFFVYVCMNITIVPKNLREAMVYKFVRSVGKDQGMKVKSNYNTGKLEISITLTT